MSYYQSAEALYNQMKLSISNVDTSKNSYIYNALFPSAMQISYALLGLDEAEKKVFASRALENGYSDYLDLRVAEVGLTRKLATYAKIEVTFTGKIGTNISSGSIISTSDNKLYSTISDVTIGSNGTITCYVLADGSGSAYNVNANEITYLPIKYNGITSVTNVAGYNSAVDKESDTDLYNRYLLKVQTPATSGNATQYKEWALSVTGIGSATIYPIWNGNGTVKVVVGNSNNRACDSTLVGSVQTYIESQMPIGCILTVLSIVEVEINISFTLTYDTSYTLSEIESNIKSNLTAYFEGLSSDTSSIKYSKVLGVIVDTDNVLDISNLTINNGVSNITLSNDQTGVLGTVTIS